MDNKRKTELALAGVRSRISLLRLEISTLELDEVSLLTELGKPVPTLAEVTSAPATSPATKSTATTEPKTRGRKKRRMSEEGRKAIAEAQRKRWAKVKKTQ